MTMKKMLALVLAVVMIVGVFAGCKPANNPATQGPNNTKPNGGEATKPNTPAGERETYTYRTYTNALGTNWNPHTWENNADSAMLSYLETPISDMTILDSENGVYQWIFVAASSVEDVTAANQGDLTKYPVSLPEGVEDPSQVTSGYVYEIKLRPEMKWQDGTPINADDYIYSMQQLLDPVMKNYRANNFYSGDGALAGAAAYYAQGAKIILPVCPPYDTDAGEEPDYSLDLTAYPILLSLTEYPTIASYSFKDFVTTYSFVNKDLYDELAAQVNADGYVPVTNANKDKVLQAMDQYLAAFGMSIFDENGEVVEDFFREFVCYDTGKVSEAVAWDTVGLYKVDEYTIRYVCATSYARDYFLGTCASGWLVHKDLYEKCKQWNEDGSFKGSIYGTSLETTMSYGVFKMASLEDQKQCVLVQNENHFEFTKNADGSLSSTTEVIGVKVDGEYVPQLLTEKVVIDVMTDDAAKLAFLKGDLDDWTVSAEDALQYSTSEQLYKVDETYTMRLFFHTNLDSLKKMDEAGNKNSVVMSNENFRKAMSLSFNRSEYVGATAGYKPAYSMLSSLYYYNVYEDPASIYRNTDEAKQAIVNLYGVEYGADKTYKTLDEAYKSINGYNLTEAKRLMKLACEELVAAGLYTEGQEIVIQMGWKAGAMDSASNQQVALLNQYVNAAVEGSGFGKVTLKAIDNLDKRYNNVADGVYAIGYGAWGGAAFYPFQNMRVYCDDEYVDPIHEKGCWDPATEELTLTVNGEEVTMTWKEWSRSMTGNGAYAGSDFSTKLLILSSMEQKLLEKYYFIPLATTTSCSMLSYKLSYYTEDYNIMYGFGGMRLLRYNYSDAEWTDYVASQGGNLAY